MTGEYTPEVLAELDARVARARARWGLSPATTITRLNVSENATYALVDPAAARVAHAGVAGSGAAGRDAAGRDAAGGTAAAGGIATSGAAARELVVRVHRLGYSSAAEIRSELAWIQALRRDGVVDTAAPVTGTDGELVQVLEPVMSGPPRLAVAFERLPGTEPPARDARRWFARLGELTARMHGHTRRWVAPAGFCRKRWDFDAMVGPQGWWGPWRAGIGLTAADAGVLERALDHIHGRLERYGAGPEVFGLVHADLRLANLLVDGERLCIIDFDDCGFSWFGYDFATAVSFIEHEPGVDELLRAWCGGYSQVRALDAAMRAELPTFVVLRRVLLTAWLASHAEVPFARRFGAGYTRGTVTLAQALLRGEFLRSAAT